MVPGDDVVAGYWGLCSDDVGESRSWMMAKKRGDDDCVARRAKLLVVAGSLMDRLLEGGRPTDWVLAAA